MIISSFVIRKAFNISRFAEKDLPAPGVPSIRPFGLLSRGTFLTGKINKKSPQDRACLLPCLVGLAVQNLSYYGVLLCGAVVGLMLIISVNPYKQILYPNIQSQFLAVEYFSAHQPKLTPHNIQLFLHLAIVHQVEFYIYAHA